MMSVLQTPADILNESGIVSKSLFCGISIFVYV